MNYPIIKEIYRRKLQQFLEDTCISKVTLALEIGVEYNTLKTILDPQSTNKWYSTTFRKIKSFLDRNERSLHG